MTKRLFIIVTALALCACSSSDTKKLAFNRYVIKTPYGADIPYEQAVTALTRESQDICDEGYRKIHDYDTGAGSQRLLVWEIGCKGVQRSDNISPNTRATGDGI